MADDQQIRQQIVDAIIKAEAQMEFSTYLHPANEKEQKEKFLTNEIENPVFTYGDSQIPSLSFPDFEVKSEIDSLYRDRMGYASGMGFLMQLIRQDEDFSALSQVLFPVSGIEGLSVTKKEPSKSFVTAEQIADTFRKTLEECELKDWSVELLDECSSRVFVNQWSKKVVIRSNVKLTEDELESLIRHEIGVHVLRYARGSMQNEPLLSVGTLLGRLIEEGVACYLENPEGHPRLFLRHFAVETALNNSFRETWKLLLEKGCDEEEAWTHVLRVKRGLSDGASHGAFTKDASYAQGYEEIKRYAESGGDFAPLLSAPIHPEEVELLKTEAKMEIYPLPDLLKN